MAAISDTYDVPKKFVKEAFHKEGDLGIVSQTFAALLPVETSTLTFTEVFDQFKHI